MAIIHRTTDRLPIKVGELVFKISPLNKYQKERIQTLSIENKLMQAAAEAIRCAVKEVEGIESTDGTPYQLELDNNGELTEECVDDLMNLEEAGNLTNICASLVNGIPKEFVNPYTGDALEGVEWIKKGNKTRKKS